MKGRKWQNNLLKPLFDAIRSAKGRGVEAVKNTETEIVKFNGGRHQVFSTKFTIFGSYQA